MRLSEAIRLGSLDSPQGFGGFADGDGRCAMGAACDAVGITSSDYVANRWPIAKTWKDGVLAKIDVLPCPQCGKTADQRLRSGHEDWFSLIYHLNDVCRWTRSQIADFVELHEPDAMLPDLPELSMICDEVESCR